MKKYLEVDEKIKMKGSARMKKEKKQRKLRAKII
jgi:hypothetical protein